MPETATSVKPGWRPDPSGRYEWRYWDGGWTNRVANASSRGKASAAPALGEPSETDAVDPGSFPSPEAAPASSVAPATPDAPATAAAPAVPTAPAVPPAPAPAVGAAPRAAAPAAPVAPSAATGAEADATAPARVEPFGVAVATVAAPAEPPAPARERKSPGAWLVAFFRSFADQPESYHLEGSDTELPPAVRGERMVTAAPGNYGHAGIIALAACGIAGGAYLPWLSGTINTIPFHQTGWDLGHGFGYSAGAAALALSALLGVRFAILRWVTLAVAIVLAGFIVRDLVNTYDAMQTMNMAARVSANVGEGLWIMIVSSAISLIALVRSNDDGKIV